ncbi:hypothetical protein [Paenibacillus sp. Soil787]|uniref:hypothetical protein n=1 Tax=Paenibacillus sp. Soil787 TaxID=1736411 RepID=UPI0007029636|nr:hypothetical protein [Paenibacillus sp. Soil787]KRF10671.1 hypothetical protein ASG93_17175 [Paenibacillus sp. Soil787]
MALVPQREVGLHYSAKASSVHHTFPLAMQIPLIPLHTWRTGSEGLLTAKEHPGFFGSHLQEGNLPYGMKNDLISKLPCDKQAFDQGFFTVSSVAVPLSKVNEKRTITQVPV